MATLTDKQLVTAATVGGFRTRSVLITAVAVALAESRGKTDAVSVTGDYGLWQINKAAHPDLINGVKDWKDPAINAGMAYSVYSRAGGSFTPWSVYKSGVYKMYVKRATEAVTGTVRDATPEITKQVQDAGGILPAITGGISWLTDPKKWLRVALFLLGIALMAFGLVKVTGASNLLPTKAIANLTKKPAVA